MGLLAGTATAQDAKPTAAPNPASVTAQDTQLTAAPAPATAQDAKPTAPPAPAPAAGAAPIVATSPVLGTSPSLTGCWENICNSCCNACSNSCCNNCCDNDPRGGFFFNFEMMFLKPHWANNPALFAGTNTLTATAGNIQFEDFNFNMQFAPKFSLGYLGASGVGVRSTWWGFAESASRDSAVEAVSALPLINAIGNSVDVTAIGNLLTRGHLNMNVWDNEVVYTAEAGPWEFLLGAGLRYAHIAQQYSAAVVDPTGATLDTLVSGHNFNGAGPTLGLDIRREIGASGLFTFANVRGSLLFGTRSNSSGVTGAETDVLFAGGTRTADSNDVFVPVGEVELGVGYQRSLGRVRLIAEGSLIAQSWWNAGNSSRSDFIFATTDEALGLFGFGLTIGLNY